VPLATALCKNRPAAAETQLRVVVPIEEEEYSVLSSNFEMKGFMQ
jgi:hypothetical protein